MLLVFAFVASGFEHSVANIALFLVALLVPHPETVSIAGLVHNLVPVTIGNIIGGGFFVGCLYVYLASQPIKVPSEVKANKYNQKKIFTNLNNEPVLRQWWAASILVFSAFKYTGYPLYGHAS